MKIANQSQRSSTKARDCGGTKDSSSGAVCACIGTVETRGPLVTERIRCRLFAVSWTGVGGICGAEYHYRQRLSGRVLSMILLSAKALAASGEMGR